MQLWKRLIDSKYAHFLAYHILIQQQVAYILFRVCKLHGIPSGLDLSLPVFFLGGVIQVTRVYFEAQFYAPTSNVGSVEDLQQVFGEAILFLLQPRAQGA